MVLFMSHDYGTERALEGLIELVQHRVICLSEVRDVSVRKALLLIGVEVEFE